MVLRVKDFGQSGETKYKTSKLILTPKDIEAADRFHNRLTKTITKIESALLKENLLSDKNRKKDPLRAWYLVGKYINGFLNERKNKLAHEDERLFWENLYGLSPLINSKIPSGRIGLNKNDFKTASLLADYPFEFINKVGPWALWREIITYKVFQDKRILEWVIDRLLQSPRTRDEARPMLKAVAARFKRIDTSILGYDELCEKLEDIQEKRIIR